MKSKIKRITSITLILTCLMSMFSSLAVNAAGQTTITLEQKDDIYYADGWGWTCVPMIADGKQVYCVQPDLPAPDDGVYSTSNNKLQEINTNDRNYNMYLKALYYCYGGDGFDTEISAFKTDTSKHYQEFAGNSPAAFMGNLKYSDGGYEVIANSGWKLHYILTHLLLSYIYYGDSYWSKTAGKVPTSGYEDAIKDLYSAIQKAPVPNTTYSLYMLDVGSSRQKVIVIRQNIRLQLQKDSANTSLTANNSCYSLEGARFNIYLNKACTDYFGYIETNKNGYGKYGAGSNGIDVPQQSYYAKEVTAPKGYKLNPTVFEFRDSGQTADGAKIYSFTCADEPGNDPITIRLKKQDKVTGLSTEKLTGAEFTVKYYDDYYNTSDDLTSKAPVRSWIIKTKENGIALLDKEHLVSGDDFYYVKNIVSLPYGTVTVQETKAPANYEINPEIYVAVITDEGGFTWLTTNKLTDEGELIIEETAIDYKGKIQIVKSDEKTTERIADCTFGIYTSDDKDNDGMLLSERKIAEMTTSNDGIATSEDLEKGTYYVQEINPAQGYSLNKTIYPVTITGQKENEIIKVDITNKQTVTKISKTDIAGEEEIPDNHLAVVDSNNNTRDSWVSTSEPHYIYGLPAGKYTLIETKPADGYAYAESIEFEVKADGSTTSVTMRNEYTNILINKIDEKGKTLADCTLHIEDMQGNVVVPDFVTDDKPKMITGQLIAGEKYKLVEIKAANGYEIAKPVEFTVPKKAFVLNVYMVDKRKTGSFTLYKQDSNGNSLAGSEWQLYTSDDKAVAVTETGSGEYIMNGSTSTMQTDENGVLLIDKLEQGSYYLIETKAPVGKNAYSKKIDFTINDTKLNKTITVKDTNVVLYQTGGYRMYMYILGGVLILLAISLCIVYYIKFIKKHDK